MRPQEGVVQQVVAADNECLVISELLSHVVVETHRHEVEQVGTVVRGQVAVVVAGEQRILGPGDCYRIPANASHGLRVFDAPATMVDCYAPPREDLRHLFEQANAPRKAAAT